MTLWEWETACCTVAWLCSCLSCGFLGLAVHQPDRYRADMDRGLAVMFAFIAIVIAVATWCAS